MVEVFFCVGHGAYLDKSLFYASSLKNRESRCKKCNCSERLKRRKKDFLTVLHWKTGRSEYRRGSKAPKICTMNTILQRFGNRSAFMHGEGELCCVRYDTNVPIFNNPWNGVIVTVLQAKRLPKIRERRMQAFPKWLQSEMKMFNKNF
jgi:hypothetical protein